MKKVWSDDAWDDYLYWQTTDRKVFARINALIKETERSPFTGTGKPEPLKYNYRGCWSRRINQEHRLIYRVTDGVLEIISCKEHYDE